MMTFSPEKVCLFMPAYNCSSKITALLDALPSPYRERSNLLVVDDGSSDGTNESLQRYRRERGRENLQIMRHSANRGYGGAQKTAYRYAIEKGYEAVFMLHGDGQHDPSCISDVLSRLAPEVALSFGSRILGNPRAGGMPGYKLAASKILTELENRLLGVNISEFHSGFRAFRCGFLRRIPFELCTEKYHFDTEILIQIAVAGFKVVETPIPTIYGEGASAGMTFPQAVKYGCGILKALGQYEAHKLGILRTAKFACSTVGSKTE